MLAAMCLAVALSAEPSFIHAYSSPHQARILTAAAMTPDQVADAPVNTLNLMQLRLEEHRLQDPPTIVTPIVLMSVGGAAMVGGALATYFLIQAMKGAGFGAIILAILAIYTGAVAVVGAVGLVAGIVLFPARQDARAQYQERLKAVHERMALIQTGQVQEPYSPDASHDNLQTEVYSLDQEKPGFGLPIALMSVGLGVGAYAGYLWGTTGSPSSSSGNSGTIIGITGIVSGLILIGIGTWVLIDRINTRNSIDAQIQELRNGGAPAGPGAPPPPPSDVPPGGDVVPPPPPPPPPSATLLPPPPIFAAVSFQF